MYPGKLATGGTWDTGRTESTFGGIDCRRSDL